MASKAKTDNKNDNRRVAANGYRLADQLPVGEVLIDMMRNEWILGEAIACGGFGEIYLVRPNSGKSVSSKKFKDSNFVIKIDNYGGPLFAEMNFYLRVAKKEAIKNWMAEKDLQFLGIPEYIASGTHCKNEMKVIKKKTKTSKEISAEVQNKYRFLVMPKFGSDLQKVLNSHSHVLSIRTAYTIVIKILDTLEYIHSYGYVHADIKAPNLILNANVKNIDSDVHSEIWLIDYGLVERFISKEDLKHYDYREDIRKANNGTIEFASRDAHIGSFSRRGDIEILGYNLLSWLSGSRLPWMSNLKDKEYVKNNKIYYMERLHELFNYAFQSLEIDNSEIEKVQTNKISRKNMTSKSSTNVSLRADKLRVNVPEGLMDFFNYIISLKFTQVPDYKLLKNILLNAINTIGKKYDGTFTFSDDTVNEKTIRGIKRKIINKNLIENGVAHLPELIKSSKTTRSSNRNKSDNFTQVNKEILKEETSPKKFRSTAKVLRNSKNSVNNDLESMNGVSAKSDITNDIIEKDESNKKKSSERLRTRKALITRISVDEDLVDDNEEVLSRIKKVSNVKTIKRVEKNENKNVNSVKAISKKVIKKKSVGNTLAKLSALDNPTPAMLELIDKLRNKNKS